MKLHLLVILVVCALVVASRSSDETRASTIGGSRLGATREAADYTIGGVRLGDTREQVEAVWGKDRYSHWPDLSPDIPAQEKPWFVEFDEDDRVCSLGGSRLRKDGTVVLETPFTEDEIRGLFGKPESVEYKAFGCRGAGFELFHYADNSLTLTLNNLDAPIQLRSPSSP